MTLSFLGRQVRFPLEVVDGSFAWSDGEDGVVDSIEMIMTTRRGERLRRPTYGAGLDEFLDDGNSPVTRERLRRRIKDALDRFEPRIQVRDIDVDVPPDDPEVVVVTISYSVTATGAAFQLTRVLPAGGGLR